MAGRANRRGWGHLRRRSSGKWQASYIGPDLMRHVAPKTFTAKMDAEHWLSDESRQIEIGTWVAPAKRVAETKAKAITLAEYAQTWIDQRTVKPRTRIGYQSLLDHHIVKTLGRVPLNSLSTGSIRAWHHGLGTDHPTRNAHAYSLLHAILKTATSDGLLTANPANLSNAMHVKAKRAAVIPTVVQVAALADTIKPERLRALVLVLAWTGPRYGEAIELRRRDVGEGCKYIRIHRAVTHRSGCRIDSPKSGEGRLGVVPTHIRAALQRHLDAYVGSDPDSLLFPAERGCHLNDRVFRDYLEPALADLGLERMTIHDLRHFAGTMAARVGNLPETMAYLGHSTPNASLLYQQVVSGRPEQMADALGELANATVKDAVDAHSDAELTSNATELTADGLTK